MFVVSVQEKDYDWQPHYILYAGEDQDKALEMYRQPIDCIGDDVYTLSVFNSGKPVCGFKRETKYKATPMSVEQLELQRSFITPGSTGCYPENNYEAYICDTSEGYFEGVGKPL